MKHFFNRIWPKPKATPVPAWIYNISMLTQWVKEVKPYRIELDDMHPLTRIYELNPHREQSAFPAWDKFQGIKIDYVENKPLALR